MAREYIPQERHLQAISDMKRRQGVYYDRWLAGLSRFVEREKKRKEDEHGKRSSD